MQSSHIFFPHQIQRTLHLFGTLDFRLLNVGTNPTKHHQVLILLTDQRTNLRKHNQKQIIFETGHVLPDGNVISPYNHRTYFPIIKFETLYIYSAR